MSITVTWLGHASFKINNGVIVYIDPWKLADSPHDASVILISHSHFDHYSEEDIQKIAGPTTRIIAPDNALPAGSNVQMIAPGETISLPDVHIEAVPAYNPEKDFHPRTQGWVGFIVQIEGKRIYYAGDTDLIPEMHSLEDVDLALLPVGGTYTMSGDEAAAATKWIKPGQAVPYHWGEIVGQKEDAELFKQQATCEVLLLNPGESVTI